MLQYGVIDSFAFHPLVFGFCMTQTVINKKFTSSPRASLRRNQKLITNRCLAIISNQTKKDDLDATDKAFSSGYFISLAYQDITYPLDSTLFDW